MREGQNKEKRYYCNDRFSVYSIQYNEEREISSLVIVNDKGQAVYAMKLKENSGTADNGKEKAADKNNNKKKAAQKKPQEESGKPSISKDQMDSLQAELDRTGITIETVQERYKIQEPETISEELYRKVMTALSKTKTKAA